jgi:hypothetical protein
MKEVAARAKPFMAAIVEHGSVLSGAINVASADGDGKDVAKRIARAASVERIFSPVEATGRCACRDRRRRRLPFGTRTRRASCGRTSAFLSRDRCRWGCSATQRRHAGSAPARQLRRRTSRATSRRRCARSRAARVAVRRRAAARAPRPALAGGSSGSSRALPKAKTSGRRSRWSCCHPA